MADGARSADAAVQRELDRLTLRSPGRDVLGLERIRALLEALGNPQRRLPPVLHVAGTNGKGSTVAFLRAMLEGAGLTAHAYTSPHLVRFNERIRLAGRLIDDAAVAPLLAEVNDAADGLGASFFEVTTAAAFLAFARTPADACIVEVGLGGRLDATNVIERPAVTGIASLGIDHAEFLLAPEPGVPTDPMARIAFEKAGIAKAGVPLVTQSYAPAAAEAIAAVAQRVGAPLVRAGADYHVACDGDAILYRDAHGVIALPMPSLAGDHQLDNLALAVAMARESGLRFAPEAARNARWPARLQRLSCGPLTAGRQAATWLDGGHNLDAAHRLARFFAGAEPIQIVLGMLANKDAAGFIAALAPVAERIVAVPVPDHFCHSPEAIAAMASDAGVAASVAPDVAAALAVLDPAQPAAILGSLYLAGEVLALNSEAPD